MPDVLPFAAITHTALDQVGGKGLSLALTAAVGLPVPPGFVVTTDAYRRLRDRPPDDPFRRAVSEAYSALGDGPVAVRSSATAEDGAEKPRDRRRHRGQEPRPEGDARGVRHAQLAHVQRHER